MFSLSFEGKGRGCLELLIVTICLSFVFYLAIPSEARDGLA